MTASVEFDEEPNGLASMLGGLIAANLEQHPEREALLKPARIGIVADDIHVSLTLDISPGKVRVENGLHGHHVVVVRTDAETLTELTSVPLRLGMPDSMHGEGRAVTRKLLRGQLRVQGIRHLAIVSRLNRLLSVA